MPELVAAIVQVRRDGAVREEGEGERDPHLRKEAVDGQCARAGRDREVPDGLEPSLDVAPLGQLAQRLGLDGAPVPVDPAGVNGERLSFQGGAHGTKFLSGTRSATGSRTPRRRRSRSEAGR